MPSAALVDDTLLWLLDAGAWGQAMLAHHAGWLGPGEAARCARFVRPERRRQFIAGRALLRRMLGRLLGVAPDTVALQERPGQAPLLVAPARQPVWFSISHSGPWVACAASTVTAVGLDVERIDPRRDVLALAEQAFTPNEVQALRACPPQGRHALFYRMWCAHEARIKLGAVEAAIMYPIEVPGRAGMLACAAPLAAAPSLELLDPATFRTWRHGP